jgi:adenylate cyclase
MLGLNYQLGWALLLSQDTDALERAFQLEQRAIGINNSLPAPYGVLSGIYVQKGQYDPAVIEAQRAVTLDPNFTEGYMWLALVMNSMGKPAEALEAVNKAMRLDPRNPDNYAYELGWTYSNLGRYE